MDTLRTTWMNMSACILYGRELTSWCVYGARNANTPGVGRSVCLSRVRSEASPHGEAGMANARYASHGFPPYHNRKRYDQNPGCVRMPKICIVAPL